MCKDRHSVKYQNTAWKFCWEVSLKEKKIEYIYKPKNRNDSLHEDSNDNDVIVLDFATSKSEIIVSGIFVIESCVICGSQICVEYAGILVHGW
jgi:hypothetical protein